MIRRDKLIVALAAFFVLGGCAVTQPAAPTPSQIGRYQIAPPGS